MEDLTLIDWDGGYEVFSGRHRVGWVASSIRMNRYPVTLARTKYWCAKGNDEKFVLSAGGIEARFATRKAAIKALMPEDE
jgi:hypothetical protein